MGAEVKCATCRWWRPCGDERGYYTRLPEAGLGECHARPPTQERPKNMLGVSIWPTTAGDDFCGEYKPRNEENDECQAKQ